MKEPRDAYKVLQVDPEADLDVIQAAYRRLAQKYHPDRADAVPDAASRMVEINGAWETLRDPGRRAHYDRQRAAAPPPRPTPTTPMPSAASASARSSPATPSDLGSAGPPPGRPSGSVLNFGRYAGWSLGEIGRLDPGYLEWLDRSSIGRAYRVEVDALLRRLGSRGAGQSDLEDRPGVLRRR